MRLVDIRSHRDPAVNLALEEVLLERYSGPEPLLVFYVNQPAVVIGRNQIPFLELNLDQVLRQNVAVVRRISGGGTVYHEPGNLNFSLIHPQGAGSFPSAGEAVRPVVESLNTLGLPARVNRQHDILLKERKITGTAQYRARGNCLTHGTLLVSADLDCLRSILVSDSEIPFSRGRASVRSPVTNVTDYRSDLTIEALRAALTRSFAAIHGTPEPVILSGQDWAEIQRMARSKYDSWAWTVGQSPEFKIRREAMLPWGRCEGLMHTKRGVVIGVELEIPEDAPAGMFRLARRLEGCRYHPDDVLAAAQAAGFEQEAPDTLKRVAAWLCPPTRWWRRRPDVVAAGHLRGT